MGQYQMDLSLCVYHQWSGTIVFMTLHSIKGAVLASPNTVCIINLCISFHFVQHMFMKAMVLD